MLSGRTMFLRTMVLLIVGMGLTLTLSASPPGSLPNEQNEAQQPEQAEPKSPAEATDSTLRERASHAASAIERLIDPSSSVPVELLQKAKGVAVLKVVEKKGLISSSVVGEGVVIARTESGWSGPSAIKTNVGFKASPIAGPDTSIVLLLNTDEALQAFIKGGNIRVGTDLSIMAGPQGVPIGESDIPTALYAYSLHDQTCLGANLIDTAILDQPDVNQETYGGTATVKDILTGVRSTPEGTESLQDVLSKFPSGSGEANEEPAEDPDDENGGGDV